VENRHCGGPPIFVVCVQTRRHFSIDNCSTVPPRQHNVGTLFAALTHIDIADADGRNQTIGSRWRVVKIVAGLDVENVSVDAVLGDFVSFAVAVFHEPVMPLTDHARKRIRLE